jgi:glycosyltransferase involved in cell wall biosynthesis
MNFAVPDSGTESHPEARSHIEGRLGARAAAATRHAVLVPSYNTGARLFDTVSIVRRLGWPMWVVIDGSTDGTGETLARTAENDPDLVVSALPHNQGKGAAIRLGMELAQARGFTHVVTVDADGQHSADHIETLVAVSRAHPEAMVLGVPVFDASAPAIRIAGHRVSIFWANVVTLRSGIGDPLFGFRAYPVAPLLRIFEETRWMRRFDFDSEAAIRLSWHGVPAINVAAPVRYLSRQEGGVSHFHYVRDNLLLMFMYARLFVELVPRLARRFIPTP